MDPAVTGAADCDQVYSPPWSVNKVSVFGDDAQIKCLKRT